MAVKKVYDVRNGVYYGVVNNPPKNTSGSGTSLVAGANALNNATNKNSGGSSDSPSNSGMSLIEGASALSNATNKNSSNSGTSLGGSGNSQYTGVGTHNDADVSDWAKREIDKYKAQYNDAIARGDMAAADAAHAAAEAIRARYGYSGGVDGSDYIKLEQDELEFDEEKPTQPQRDPRIDALLNEILNREDFSYDVMNDPLYQQYAQMYQREGDRAMRETMAEAAAGAGGMNSYAITAAHQANNYYGSQLNDKIPELYQLAYEMYLNDKESKVQDLGLLQNMDATQYNRYRDTMNDWYNDRNFAYGMYRDDVADKQWQTTFDYNDYWANKNFDYNDAWKNKEWNATQSDKEYDRNLYDQESAKDEVWKYIELGITPSAELIAKAGMSESDVALAVAAVKAQSIKPSTTSSTKSTSKKTTDYGDEGDGDEGDKKGDEGNGDEGTKKDTSDSILNNSFYNLGLGTITEEYLLKLAEAGRVILTEEEDESGNKVIKARWANGYNKDNYRNNLSPISLPGFDWGL